MGTGVKDTILFQDHVRVSQIQDILEDKINKRPDRQYLIQHHILNDSHVAPSLQVYEQSLKRARLADNLNDKLLKRPGPLELVEHNILQANSFVKEVLRDGLIPYEKTTDINQDRLPSTRFNFDDYSNISPILSSQYNLSSPPPPLNYLSDSQHPAQSTVSDSYDSEHTYQPYHKYCENVQCNTDLNDHRDPIDNLSNIQFITDQSYNHNNNNNSSHYSDKCSSTVYVHDKHSYPNEKIQHFYDPAYAATEIVSRGNYIKKRRAKDISKQSVHSQPVETNCCASNRLAQHNLPATEITTVHGKHNINRHRPLIFHEYSGPLNASSSINSPRHLNMDFSNVNSHHLNENKQETESNRHIFDYYKILLHQQRIFLHLVQHFQLSADMAANCIHKQNHCNRDSYSLNKNAINHSTEIDQCEILSALKQLRVTDLRAHCRKHGLVVGGTKDELIQRIREFARNSQPLLHINDSHDDIITHEKDNVNWSDHYFDKTNQLGFDSYLNLKRDTATKDLHFIPSCQNESSRCCISQTSQMMKPYEELQSVNSGTRDNLIDQSSHSTISVCNSLDDSLRISADFPSADIGQHCDNFEDLDISQLFSTIEKESSHLSGISYVPECFDDNFIVNFDTLSNTCDNCVANSCDSSASSCTDSGDSLDKFNFSQNHQFVPYKFVLNSMN